MTKTKLTLLATISALFTGPISAKETLTAGLLIDRVNIVDVRTGSIAKNRAIIIADGRISRIAAARSITAGPAATRIDGRGAFIVPGYNDMHSHNLNAASPQTSLPLMLANGVTGIRQMVPAANRQVPADSPAILAVPGTILVGPAFATPAAAKAEVDRQKQVGVDFIKVVDIPEAAFLAAAEAAKADGLPISGHLPPTVDVRDAIARGFDAIEHLGPGISLLLACSTDETAIRATLRAVPPGVGGIDFNMEPAKLARLLANPMMTTPPQGFAVIKRVLATYDDKKCRAVAHDLAASKTWVVPTLTRLEAMNLGNDPSLRNNSDLRYVPAGSRALWLAVGDDFDTRLSAEQRADLAALQARQMKLVKVYDDAGVKMLAGTDFGGQWIVSGRSLHHEFDLLASAGVSPLHILQMTTINAARYLGREADMGAVEPGKLADLVFLTANPMKGAGNLHAIAGVVRGGRYLPKSELDAISASVAATLQKQ